MSEDFDPNVVVAEYLKQNTDDILALAKGIFKDTADTVRLRLDRTYRTYLAALIERYSKTKSFILYDARRSCAALPLLCSVTSEIQR